MLNLEFVSEFLYQHLNRVSVKPNTNGQEFIARCPLCGDSKKSLTKRRFHVKYKNDDNIVYQCFNCHRSGSFISLYAELMGMTTREAFKKLKKIDLSNIKTILKQKKQKKVIENPVNDIIKREFSSVLKDCLSLNSTPDGYVQQQLYNTLVKFKNDRKIENYDIYIAYKGFWKNRIILPIYDNNDLIYFQGRTIYSDCDPKYLNPKSEKKEVILNKNYFEKDKYIVICEGLLDALSIGKQGTVCLGASIDDDFIKRISEYTEKGIIIALDNDSTGKKQMMKIIDDSIYANKIKYFIFPHKYKKIKDLNEFKVKNDKYNVYDFVVKNSFNNIATKIKIS